MDIMFSLINCSKGLSISVKIKCRHIETIKYLCQLTIIVTDADVDSLASRGCDLDAERESSGE